MATSRIESYQFGRIVIDGELHTKDAIILPDRVVGAWWRIEGHVLNPEDLVAIFDAAPEVLVVGTGSHGMLHVTSETQRALDAANIELIALSTAEACRTYNQIHAEKPTAAALHLTC
jgi:hypothetical protein